MADEKPLEASDHKPGQTPAASPPTPQPKPAAKDPSTPSGDPWTGELAETVKGAFPSLEIQAWTYLGQNYLIIPREEVLQVCLYLKDEGTFALLADLTAVDYPKRERRFDVIYQLFSFSRNERLR